MSEANFSNVTAYCGPRDATIQAAEALAEAARVNAKAILEIARALKGPVNATGISVVGDTIRHEASVPWRGEGFYPPPPRPDGGETTAGAGFTFTLGGWPDAGIDR